MPRPLPDSRLDAVVDAVKKYPDGATLMDVAFALNPLAALRNVQRWLRALVKQKRLVREGSTRGVRYKVPTAVADNTRFMPSLEGSAIQCLVNQPVEVRAPADYRRISIESYVPNARWYVEEKDRARLAAPVANANGAAPVQPWRNPAILDRIVIDLAWRSGWLEARWIGQGLASLSMPDVTAWLAQPETIPAQWDVQLVWNQRTAFNLLLSAAPNVAVTRDWMVALHRALAKRLAGPRPRGQGQRTRDQGRETGDAALLPNFIRTESLDLAGTTYTPSADWWAIEMCYNEIMGWAGAIKDPIEQAFFVLVHLLYLEPFGMLNASMACLAVNIPLLRAGLPPVTFAGVAGSDLLDGIRGVWELNRTELLRDVFVFACEDCRERYALSA